MLTPILEKTKAMLDRIRIVLVNTSHPGNIGSAARAMKTMGLSQLYLVKPKLFPNAKATELAAGADDILEQAIVVPSLLDAIAPCRLTIGTSVRSRELPLAVLTPQNCASKLIKQTQHSEVALVFGREHAGLTNQELAQCQFQVTIPSNPEYSSLNLAQAVQVLCYEIYSQCHTQDYRFEDNVSDAYATAKDIEHFYQHLETVLTKINFLKPQNPRRSMQRLRRLFTRIRLEEMEVNLLRGILSMMESKL